MATYQVRVEDRIGTIGDTQAISDWLTSGAKFVTNILPIERLIKYTTNLTDSGSGISVTTYRVISANKSGYGAREVSHNLSAQVSNSGSIHYAGTTDPVFYILNGSAYVKPSGGTVVAMAYPTVLFLDSTITSFPSDLDEIVVVYASIQGRLRQMSDLTITTLGGLSISTITKPTAPSAPVFVYTDATAGTIASTSISFSDTLSYTPPVFGGSYTNADTALTNQDIELANAHLNKVNSQLEIMQKDLLNSLNEFNKDKGEFDANLQIAISQAQLTQQRLIESAQISTDVSKQNEAQELARQVQEYSARLQGYGQEVNSYATEINQEVSRVGQRINQYNIQFQQYALGLEILRKEFENLIKAI